MLNDHNSLMKAATSCAFNKDLIGSIGKGTGKKKF